jgi:hypothetical protein
MNKIFKIIALENKASPFNIDFKKSVKEKKKQEEEAKKKVFAENL